MRTCFILFLSCLICLGQGLFGDPVLDLVLQVRPTVSTGLVPDLVWWKMNENTGTTTADSAGTNTMTHDADWVTGVAGYGLGFNGSSDNGTTGLINYNTNQITLTAWMLITQTNASSIIFEGSPNFYTAGGVNYHVQLTRDILYVGLGIGAVGYRRETNTVLFATNTWTHLTIALDASFNEGDIRVWTNMVEMPMITINDGFNTAAPFMSTNLYVGARQDNSSFFNGKLDDVRIYTGLRTNPADMTLIYSNPQ